MINLTFFIYCFLKISFIRACDWNNDNNQIGQKNINLDFAKNEQDLWNFQALHVTSTKDLKELLKCSLDEGTIITFKFRYYNAAAKKWGEKYFNVTYKKTSPFVDYVIHNDLESSKLTGWTAQIEPCKK